MLSSRRAGFPPVFFVLGFFFFGFLSPAQAQDPILRWADHYGGEGHHQAHGIVVDAADNIILTGNMDGTVDFGSGPLVGAGGDDIFLAKFNAAGTPSWSRRYGDPATQYGSDVAVDGQGNIILVGSFFGTADFGGEPLVSAGTFDIFVAKFDAFGDLIWSSGFGDADAQSCHRVAVDSAGHIILTGFFWGTVDFGGEPLTDAGTGDIFLVKLDADGNHLWSDSYGDASRQYGRGLAVDGSDNIYLTGYQQGAVDFGAGPLVSAGSFDCFIAKFDPDGGHIWSSLYGGAEGQYVESVAVDGSDNVVLAGYFQGTVDFGGELLTSSGEYDILVAKFDSGGNHIWSNRFGDAAPEYALGVAVDDLGDFSVTGYFEGAVNFGGGLLLNEGPDDVFIAKFLASGEHFWSMSTGDGEVQYGQDVTVDGSNNVLAAGHFRGFVDFGDGHLVAAGTDLFIAKFGPLPSAVLPSLDGGLLGLRSYPNPFNPVTTIDFSVPENGLARLGVYDVQGRLVRTLVSRNLVGGNHSLSWNGWDEYGREVASGAYFLRLEVGGQEQTLKIVTVK